MKRQTAVEWLLNQIQGVHENSAIAQQAKAMEKDQIEDAWDISRRDIDYPANGKQYYNETYGGKQ